MTNYSNCVSLTSATFQLRLSREYWNVEERFDRQTFRYLASFGSWVMYASPSGIKTFTTTIKVERIAEVTQVVGITERWHHSSTCRADISADHRDSTKHLKPECFTILAPFFFILKRRFNNGTSNTLRYRFKIVCHWTWSELWNMKLRTAGARRFDFESIWNFFSHPSHTQRNKTFSCKLFNETSTVSWDRSAELFSRATSSPHILCFFLIILRLLRKSFFTFWLTQKAILCDTLSPLCDIKLTFVHSKSIRRCGTLIFYFSMRQQLKICHLAKANSACLSRKMWFKTAEGFSFFSLS